MKNFKELKGAKALNKIEQKAINGGKKACHPETHQCPPGYVCVNYGYWHSGFCTPEMPFD